MRWLWFVASLICFAVVFKTPSMGLAVLCLIAALVFILVGTVAVASSRIDSQSRSATTLLGPDELRRMREIDAKRRAGGTAASDVSAPMVVAGGVLLADASTSPGRAGDQDALGDVSDLAAGGGDTAGGDGGGDGGGGD